MIKDQIGRDPRGVLGVNKICEWGYPQVIVNRPVFALVSDIEVFPTLYWLTCPYLRKEVALLEAEGLIAEFETRVQDDPKFAEQLAKSHQSYAEERLALIPADVQERMKQEYPERYRVLAESGVGGSRSIHGVKCLHMHLADYLARGENPIGAEVVKILAKPLSCPDALCKEFDQ
ncbi:MAG: DUF501 domain-containing protein [Firmicutes bacterium]|nr:DUF501 domain-containing protein [Bacillota bacterium]